MSVSRAARRRWWLIAAFLAVVALWTLGGTTSRSTPRAPHGAASTAASLGPRYLPRPLPQVVDTAGAEEARALAAAPLPASGTWTPLTGLRWRRATSGLLALADRNEPRLGAALPDGLPLVAGGQLYAQGIGTLPFSEIEYELPPDAAGLRVSFGLNDLPAVDAGSAVFRILGDGVELYASDVLRHGDGPQTVELNVAGVRRLTLVVDDAGDGNTGDYADWLEPAVLRTGSLQQDSLLAEAISRARGARQAAVAAEQGALGVLAAAELQAAAAVLEPSIPDSDAVLRVGDARAAWDAGRHLAVLGNDALLLTLGVGGEANGTLTAVDRRHARLLCYDVAPAVRLSTGEVWRLPDLVADARAPYTLTLVEDPALGRGVELVARYRPREGPGVLTLRLALWAARAAFTVTLEASDLPDGVSVAAYEYFHSQGSGGFVVGDDGAYLADRSRLWDGTVVDDGFARRASVEGTKPLILWNAPDGALLMTMLDCVDAPAYVTVQRSAGRAVAALRWEFPDVLQQRPTTSPRLYVEALPGADLRSTVGHYRQIMDALYPAASAPFWLRQQLGTWYIYASGVDDARLRAQLDYLATYLNDLGPWHVVIDAGWYLSYGDADSEFYAVDYERFPDGIRALVDYAHARGIYVVLYLPTGYIHDGRGDGEWLARPTLIQRRPEWLIPLYTHDTVGRYLLDYRLPDVQRHVGRVLEQVLGTFGADGISLDGLADAEGQLIPLAVRQMWHGAAPIQRASEIYALFAREAFARRPDAYIETGWMTPVCARPYATTFRYADEVEDYLSPYPFGGFETHFDYAVWQTLLFGQRPNMGANTGDPNRPDALTWLRGALALGAQATLSFDLTRLSPERLVEYRAHLTHLRPFEGETRFDAAVPPTTVAHVRGPLVYTGVINREDRARTIRLDLAALGLETGVPYTYYDVENRGFGQLTDGLAVSLPPRSFRLLVMRRTPGVLWTPSSFEETPEPGGLRVVLDGPPQVEGMAWLASPPPAAVLLDGQPLAVGATPGYQYDAAHGVLQVRYAHNGPRTLEVRWPE
ncbi:MAG: NPCBM/NEW2 domain-containing protein [Chloroflexi bacterium]|nr:NPCBM/NEW2 domain-containing protein [Chloroflexota bacterium]